MTGRPHVECPTHSIDHGAFSPRGCLDCPACQGELRDFLANSTDLELSGGQPALDLGGGVGYGHE